MNMNLMETRRRFEELDGLRGIAAVWVVIFHLTFGLGYLWLPDQPSLVAAITPFAFNLEGLLAVDLFFIISGFVICMTMERSATVLDFLTSRFARLFPAYWAAVAVALAIGIYMPSPQLPVTFGQGIVNLSMAQAYLGVPSVNPSFWSLAVELGFYGLMTLIMLTNQRNNVDTLGLVWVLLGFVSTHLLPLVDFALPWRLSTALVLEHASLFYAGILFYRIRTDRLTLQRAGGIALCLALRTSFASLTTTAIECIIFGIFALCVSDRLPILRARPLLFLGTISYSLYVVHQPLSFRIQLGLHALGATPWLNLGATFSVLVAISAALTYCIERPGGRIIRRIAALRFRRHAIGPAI
jgi:peptidoglycan/LPS O-acetylase OafA/YrhL